MEAATPNQPWAPKACWNPYALSKLPGAYFFPNRLTQEQQKEFLSTYSSQLEFSKKGYISGLKGPGVCAVQARNKSYVPCLSRLVDIFKNDGVPLLDRDPFQISINSYSPGEYMVPHKDGLGNMGLIITLGSSVLLDFYHAPRKHQIRETEVYDKASGWARDIPGRQIADEPNVSVLMVPGSCLLLSGESFVDYVHAIDGRKSDTITDKVCNIDFLPGEYQVGDTLTRANRVSLVMWDVDAIERTIK